MRSLQTLLDALTGGRRLHISIVDISGVLSTPSTEITYENAIHSKMFCRIAKSTERGYRLCLNCKGLANERAATEKTAFCGYCLYGLFEAVLPVVIDGAVAAVVYVGNAVVDEKATLGRIGDACRYTGVDSEKLGAQISECERIEDADELFAIAEIVSDYLKMLYHSSSEEKKRSHWLVAAIKRHADEEYCQLPTLKELATIYRKNEKYMGRLFEREMGVSFNKYCLDLRLSKAERRLRETSDKIIDIAYECGFENISYFNRAFKKRYGTSPTEYRRAK